MFGRWQTVSQSRLALVLDYRLPIVDYQKKCAGIAQLVERNLAKVEVASSNLVSRSNYSVYVIQLHKYEHDTLMLSMFRFVLAARTNQAQGSGELAKRLCSGLQLHLDRFDSGTRLQNKIAGRACFFMLLLCTIQVLPEW